MRIRIKSYYQKIILLCLVLVFFLSVIQSGMSFYLLRKQTIEHSDALSERIVHTLSADINDYFDLMMIWYRDVLLYKATRDMNGLIFRDEFQQISKMADRSTYEGIETIVNALQQAKRRLDANVNFDLTMELLLLTIKEN